MTTLVVPCDLMREIARVMGTDTESLLLEHQERWHQIQTLSASLPTSVQSVFNDFLAVNTPRLTDALTVRQHIGHALSQSADLTQGVDDGLAQGFDELAQGL
jgi:hypothetical protein